MTLSPWQAMPERHRAILILPGYSVQQADPGWSPDSHPISIALSPEWNLIVTTQNRVGYSAKLLIMREEPDGCPSS